MALGFSGARYLLKFLAQGGSQLFLRGPLEADRKLRGEALLPSHQAVPSLVTSVWGELGHSRAWVAHLCPQVGRSHFEPKQSWAGTVVAESFQLPVLESQAGNVHLCHPCPFFGSRRKQGVLILSPPAFPRCDVC